MSEPSLQDRHAPGGTCFGCGSANEKGLRIKSFPRGDEVVADWTAEPHHEAWPGMLSGGVAGTLLDCHSNWTAMYHLMRKAGADEVPPCVTAEYAVKLKRPIPTSGPIHLAAKVVEATDDRATVEARIEAGGVMCATCRGVFVAVRPGHPAFERWKQDAGAKPGR